VPFDPDTDRTTILPPSPPQPRGEPPRAIAGASSGKQPAACSGFLAGRDGMIN